MHPQGYPRRRGFVGFFLLLILLGLPWSPARAQGLEGRVTALEREVATLKTTVNRLASEVAALAQPDSATVIFAENRPIPFTTDPVAIGEGWTKMTVSVGTTGFLCDYALQVPINGTYVEQLRVHCDCGAVCPVVSIPVISDVYRFSTGTAGGNVTAAGVVEK